MPTGTSDGKYFEDEWEASVSQFSDLSQSLSEKGNIDLTNRPKVKNPEGGTSTVFSMSFNEDGKEILIPRVAHDGSGILEPNAAIDQYRSSGLHLGKFDTPDLADKYAEYLHQTQAQTLDTMPSTATEKPAGALKSEEATLGTPEKQNQPNTYDALGNVTSSIGEGLPGDKGEDSSETVIGALLGLGPKPRFQTWPERAVRELNDHIKTFMTTEPGSPENVAASTNVAFGLGIGGISTAGFKPGVGMFGGRMSKEAVQAATNLEKHGLAPDKIKYYTGLERGAEGMWRKEISDVDAALKGGYNDSDILKNVLGHEPLFRAYPELKNIPVHFVDKESLQGASGLYAIAAGEPYITVAKGMSAEETKKTLLHEIQHAIQDKEGFALASGLTPEMKDMVKGKIIRDQYKDHLESIATLIDTGQLDEARMLAKGILNRAENKAYRSLSSETEAFNVENRMNLTPEQLRKSLGKETEDVPRKHQIVPDQADLYTGSPYRQFKAANENGQLMSQKQHDYAQMYADMKKPKVVDNRDYYSKERIQERFNAPITPLEQDKFSMQNALQIYNKGKGSDAAVKQVLDETEWTLGKDGLKGKHGEVEFFDPLGHPHWLKL